MQGSVMTQLRREFPGTRSMTHWAFRWHARRHPVQSSRRRVGPLFHDLPHVLDGLGALTRIPRAVAEEEAVEVLLREVVVPWHHRELHPKAHNATDDVVFHAAVHRQDMHLAPQAPGLEALLLLPRDFCHEVPGVGVVEGDWPQADAELAALPRLLLRNLNQVSRIKKHNPWCESIYIYVCMYFFIPIMVTKLSS